MPAARRSSAVDVSSPTGTLVSPPTERHHRGIRTVNGERVIRFPTVGKLPILGKEMVSCPGCGEKLRRTAAAMRRHSISGCGEMVSLPQLHGLIERERRKSRYGPGYVSVQDLHDAIEKLSGSKNWFVGGDMELVLEGLGDMSL
ncbi:hypothetical protein FRC07_010019 [Ceratobasidium sp. 392]|nr:hypothetical protein FRC07_010019 [Ceratobasidium sp. 392]